MPVLLYAFVPFHFAHGSLHIADALKESFSYFLGNSLEELMFRGFLLVVLSRFAGWRIAVLALAIPFGLFHLQGSGISTVGLKMVATTATYSLVFSLSYVLTGSMWTAISVHVTSNILLHTLLGLDGMNQAMLVPVFSGPGLRNHDLGFWGAMISALAMSCLLYLAVSYKFNNVAENGFLT
jgi:membrane protease YdiL (CAAX protease family)